MYNLCYIIFLIFTFGIFNIVEFKISPEVHLNYNCNNNLNLKCLNYEIEDAFISGTYSMLFILLFKLFPINYGYIKFLIYFNILNSLILYNINFHINNIISYHIIFYITNISILVISIFHILFLKMLEF